ncbi:unnamed protein product [Rotaria sp. Silwood1]|nr:unnamed protein product [Rotaria sp. Silwood1]CAF1649306.1 unnamed protein product [Rotaria sp. Silwood1]
MSTIINTVVPLYQPKINIEGVYTPYPGYTIVSHALHPLPKSLTALVDYLSSSELEKYYSFLPRTSYHVTINPLENVHDEHQELLREEQRKLIKYDTSSVCTAESISYRNNILLNVQFKDDNHQFEDIIKRVRSDKLIYANILPKYTMSWHLALAYKYKDIKNDETQTRLDEVIRNIPEIAKFPFDIPLDQIEICHFDDMTKFTPINVD